jgi:hypothetical protein
MAGVAVHKALNRRLKQIVSGTAASCTWTDAVDSVRGKAVQSHQVGLAQLVNRTGDFIRRCRSRLWLWLGLDGRLSFHSLSKFLFQRLHTLQCSPSFPGGHSGRKKYCAADVQLGQPVSIKR